MNSSLVKSATGKEEPAEKLGEGGPLALSCAIWGKAVSVWYAMFPKNVHYKRVRIRHCRWRNILYNSRRVEECRNTRNALHRALQTLRPAILLKPVQTKLDENLIKIIETAASLSTTWQAYFSLSLRGNRVGL